VKELLKLNRYFYRYKGPMLLGLVFLAVANVFLVWGPVVVRNAIDEVRVLSETNTVSGSVWEVLTHSEAGWMLAKQALWLTLSVVGYGVLLFATRQTIIVASRRIEYDMRNEIYAHLQQLPASYFAKTRVSDIYVRATEDIVRVREYFGPAYMYFVNTIFRAGIIVGMMFWVNVELTLWALLPLPVLSYAAWWMSGFIHKRSTLIQEQYANLAGRAQEAFSSIRLIKAYAREEYEQKRFVEESEAYRRKKLSRDLVESLFFPMLNLLIGFSMVLVVWKGGLMVVEGAVTVGNIAEFLIDVLYLTWPVASLGYTVNLVQRAAASQIRISELMASPVQHSVRENPVPVIPDGDIRFENVSFTYPAANRPAVENITLHIPKGGFVAIVGKTGSGKTTLFNLLTRLYDPQAGTISTGGIALQDIPLEKWRAKTAIVPQDTFLFSDSIASNISFGVDNATREQIEDAATKARLKENVDGFPKGFETMLGERGITLSGGQKQRTSIARAIIRNPEMLLLDDALSAVDSDTEKAILGELRGVMKNVTSVIISHRLSTIKDADTIYVMDEGRIAEQGTHEGLLQQQGLYFNMYQKQMLEKELLEN
jgi:ATP-binding cassette subfamily B protein